MFSILGTIYGGDGRTTFGLPDLKGRTAVGRGHGPGLTNVALGEKSGSQTVTLNTLTMPSHTHSVTGGTGKTVLGPGTADNAAGVGNSLAASTAGNIYNPTAPNSAANLAAGSMHATSATINNTGTGNPFDSRTAYLTLNYIICLQGTFPARN